MGMKITIQIEYEAAEWKLTKALRHSFGCHLGKVQISNFPMLPHPHFEMTLIYVPKTLPRNFKTSVPQIYYVVTYYLSVS